MNPTQLWQLTKRVIVGAIPLIAIQYEAAFAQGTYSKPAIVAKSSAPAEPPWPQANKSSADAPNIVIVLLDDVGFGAASTYGGPAQTPALDQLAARGLRYNRFHVVASCSPTRASLLSGRNHHRVSFGTVAEIGNSNPGYTSSRNLRNSLGCCL